MDPQTIRRLLDREPNTHKYDYGHVLVVGGSPGMVGAPLLAGKAALRIGAGLVTIASSALVIDKLEERVEEIMTLRIADVPRTANTQLQKFVTERHVSVLVFGPGLRVNAQTTRLLGLLMQSLHIPVVIDGGGLTALSGNLAILDTSISETTILTPHVGEFQSLIQQKLPSTRPLLKPIASQFAKVHRVTLVLKGQPTYIVQPSGLVRENVTGNPGMATAGTGDVLSGMLAGLIAQRLEVNQAVVSGVYLHGLAGDIAAEEKTKPAMIASDVIAAIPTALKHISKQLR